MKAKPSGCSGCPWERRGRSYVPGVGPPNPEIVCLGQGPGEAEAKTGIPFHPGAPSGRRLTAWLQGANFDRSRVYLDNSVRCWIRTKGNDEAPAAAIAECYRRHWGPTIHRILTEAPDTPIVAVGTPIGRYLLGSWVSIRAAGTYQRVTLPPLETPK